MVTALKPHEKKVSFPVIVGVSHASEKTAEEIARIKTILEYRFARGAKTVGLELPENYERLGIDESVPGYFHKVADIAKGMGFRVVPLEKADLYEESWPLGVAKAYIRGGGIDLGALDGDEAGYRRALAEAEDDLRAAGKAGFYTPPELGEEACRKRVAYDKRWLGYYAKARELIGRAGGSAEEIMREWKGMQEKRDKALIEAVRQGKPDITIVGGAHARALKAATGMQCIELARFKAEDGRQASGGD